MREDYKNDWVTASLVDDLNYLKTGVEEYEGNKDYYSTGSIKDDSIITEGAYTYNGRHSRANRVGRIGDILQARMKDTDKAVLINDNLNDQLFSTGFFQIRTDSRTILPKYLFHYFKSLVFLNQKDTNCSGSTQSALNDKSAKNLLVPIAPIPLQRKIVSKIEELFSDLDKGIDDLKKAQDQLKVYRQAVLKKAFEGELTKEWREQQTDLPTADELLEQIKEERQKHYEQQLENWKQAVKAWEEDGKEGQKPTRISKPKIVSEVEKEDIEKYDKIPETWQWSRFGNVTYKIGDIDHKMPKTVEGGMPYLSTGNIKANGTIDFNNAKTISKTDFERLALKIKPEKGDIIFPRYGTIGRNILIDFDTEFLVSYSCAIVKNITSLMDAKFALYYSISPVIKREIKRYTVQTTQANIGIASIELFVFPLCSKKEQHQIVQEIESRLSVCDNVEESITESLEKAKALRQSILKKAFEGTLLSEEEIATCKAAPDYEPASVLLEKIKEEKEKRELEEKKKKQKAKKKTIKKVKKK